MAKTTFYSMGTKQCPYCGEEILETAKKCRYCGEWFNSNDAPKSEKTPEQTSAEPAEQSSINYMRIISACWIAILFSVLYAIEKLKEPLPMSRMIVDTNLTYHGMVPADDFIMPQWLACIILGISLFIVFMSLSDFCRKKNFAKTPLIAIACIIAIMYFIYFLEDVFEDSSVLLLIIFFIAEFVLALIAGIKFYNNSITRPLGVGFILYAMLPLAALMVSMFVGNEIIYRVWFLLGTMIGNIILMLGIRNLVKHNMPSDSDNGLGMTAIFSKAKKLFVHKNN